jgi:hypothetical protein
VSIFLLSQLLIYFSCSIVSDIRPDPERLLVGEDNGKDVPQDHNTDRDKESCGSDSTSEESDQEVDNSQNETGNEEYDEEL